MLKYSPPNAQYVKPQDLLVRTTYNPHSVPTFIEDTVDFVAGCPVHPNGKQQFDQLSPPSSPSRTMPAARPVVLQRSAEKKVSSPASSRKHSAVPLQGSQPPTQVAAENFGRAGSPTAQPRVLAGYEPSFAREQTIVSDQACQNKESSQPQYSYLPYTPTYPPTADHPPLHRPTTPPTQSYNAGSRFGLSNTSGIVDVMNSSTSEGYTTVSAVRRMRPTKQCC